MANDYSQEITDQLISFMDKNGYHYRFDRENGVLFTQFNCKGAMSSISILFDIKSWCYLSYGLCALKADETVRKEVAKYLMIANYGIPIGNFELDFSDGEIRYKVATDCTDGSLSDAVIQNGITAVLNSYQKYGTQLLRVMLGMEKAEAAAELADNNA